MKKRSVSLVSVIISFLFFLSCEEQKPLVPTTIDEVNILPMPNTIKGRDYGFIFNDKTVVQVSDRVKLREMAQELRQYLKAIPYELPLRDNLDQKSNKIVLSLVSKDSIVNSEGYILNIEPEQIVLAASTPQGIYRGLQTFKQLLPVEMLAKEITRDSLILPGLQVVDEPLYPYRGMMLDVSRHFFTVDQVKTVIDQIAFYKMNKLHLHLADDQGWRIEIKSWPKLTEIGGSTAVGGGKGGFYTQEDYKEIVRYAATKFITIIPEIDMPGHTNAALASYPELNCDGKAAELYTGMRVGFSSLCVDKEITYTFINDVIRELAAITPGDYIHLGGDESHSTPEEDYKIFLKRAFAIVEKHDKKVMGWEDIQSAGVTENMILQNWKSKEIIQKGLEQSSKVVLSPAKKMYLDMKYTEKSSLGLNWAGYVDIDSAYALEPKKMFESKYQKQILGLESPLWSETISTSEDIEYLMFPRIIGHAEIAWSAKAGDWNSYKERLLKHYRTLEVLDINYYQSQKIGEIVID